MKNKPHIVLNRHRNVPRKYRCFWGRYNSYADNVTDAFKACLRAANMSKYLLSDMRRYPQLRAVLPEGSQ